MVIQSSIIENKLIDLKFDERTTQEKAKMRC